jgi:hypothetical protein
LDQIFDVIKRLKKEPKILRNRFDVGILTAELVEEMLFNSLQSVDNWIEIAHAFATAFQGHFSHLHTLVFQRNFRPRYPEVDLAFMAIYCSDKFVQDSISLEEWVQSIGNAKDTFPQRIFGIQPLGWYGFIDLVATGFLQITLKDSKGHGITNLEILYF